MKKNFQSPVICHLGIIVNDVEKAADKFCAIFDCERSELYYTGTMEGEESVFNGDVIDSICTKVIVTLSETFVLEFIAPDDKPSIWRKFLNEHGPGIHHVAIEVKGMSNYTSILKENEIPLEQNGKWHGGQYAYLNANKEFGLVLELLENN